MTWPFWWVNPRSFSNLRCRIAEENLWTKHPRRCEGKTRFDVPITFKLRKETNFFGGKPKQLRKCDAYFSTFNPPKTCFFGLKIILFPTLSPPNPTKMGVDRKHLELCNKKSKLIKNSMAQLFGQNLHSLFCPNLFGPLKNPPETSRNGIDGPPWAMIYIRAQKSWRVELSCPCLGNPHNGYINPYYWVDDHPLYLVKLV